MAFLSLQQTPASNSNYAEIVDDTQRAQSLGAQRKRKSDAAFPTSESRSTKLPKPTSPSFLHTFSCASSLSPANETAAQTIFNTPTAHIEDYFNFESQILGSGQFGTVRRCTETATGAQFACKTLLKSRLVTEADREEVRREVCLMRRAAGDAGVAQLRAVFEDASAVHLVMELCEGGELFDELVRRGRLAETDAAQVFQQIVAAVAHCHSRGVLHRDLKPENILLASAPSASPRGARAHPQRIVTKIADFGLALALNQGETARGVAGSPFYIAPEVLTGEYGLAADVWSLGVILYILLSGVPPFWGPNDTAVFVQVLRGEVDFAEPAWAQVSADAKALIRALLQKDPAGRPSAADVLAHPWIVGAVQREAASSCCSSCCTEVDGLLTAGGQVAVPRGSAAVAAAGVGAEVEAAC